VPAGQVTGFLGPDGAGKPTTMRLILGLDAPDSGTVTVGGRPYAAWRRPLLQAGALLEAKAFHGGRTARSHPLCLADSNGISRSRVGEVLDLAGLAGAAGPAPRSGTAPPGSRPAAANAAAPAPGPPGSRRYSSWPGCAATTGSTWPLPGCPARAGSSPSAPPDPSRCA
jgi:ABC-2 type transport system ATP-binding protein